jgi:cell shape-determining protein MreC
MAEQFLFMKAILNMRSWCNVQEQKVDANKVINYLSQELAQVVKGKAILQATADDLAVENQKLKELVKAYEEKEKLNAAK